MSDKDSITTLEDALRGATPNNLANLLRFNLIPLLRQFVEGFNAHSLHIDRLASLTEVTLAGQTMRQIAERFSLLRDAMVIRLGEADPLVQMVNEIGGIIAFYFEEDGEEDDEDEEAQKEV